jgi:multicomponent K+:H+ antiporter subunit D
VSHWIVAPIVIPAVVAPFLILVLAFDPVRQRIVSIGATLALLAVAIGLFALAGDGVVRPYRLGDWPAPFGIVLVLDRLSATMLLLTATLATPVVVFASTGWDQRGRHFHALFQFQLMGLAGAFLTGDVFNLFVFFEVMLIASYGLLLHGGGAPRLKAGFHYVAINLAGSTLFLFAVGLIYAVTGTLNLADLAAKVPDVAAGDRAILQVGALLLFLVFALKAAAVPLHWWLPTAYPAASAPAAALFMVMTKVGAYAILRVHGVAFPDLVGPWLFPAALATLVFGAVGLLAAKRLADLVAHGVVWSMGSLLVVVALADGAAPDLAAKAYAAALYYAVHSTVAGAALFLLAGILAETRGRDRIAPAAGVGAGDGGAAALLFFLGAIAFAGLPPLSGFLGKLLILDATRASPNWATVWTIVLVTSLAAIVAFARAGSTLFWKPAAAPSGRAAAATTAGAGTPALVRSGSVAVLIALTALLAGFAHATTQSFDATARQMVDRKLYIEAVLGQPGGRGREGGP